MREIFIKLMLLNLCCLLCGTSILAEEVKANLDWSDPAVMASIIQSGEPIPLQAINISTPSYPVSARDFLPRIGTYVYEVSWQGIPAAEASIGIDREGDNYRMTTKVKTFSAIDLFYKLRFKANVTMRSDFRPLRTVIEQRQNSKLKTYSMTFGNDGVIDSVRTEQGKDDIRDTFNPHNDTLDPFSSAFIARGVDWSDGKSREFDVFNGKCRYLVRMAPLERKVITHNGEEREVWVIEPKVSNLSKPTGKSKLREAKIYLSTGPEREIIKITSSVLIGTVTTKLRNYQPQVMPVIQLAQAAQQ